VLTKNEARAAQETLRHIIQWLDQTIRIFNEDNNIAAAGARLTRWESQSLELISRRISAEGANKLALVKKPYLYPGDKEYDFLQQTKLYMAFLMTLKQELEGRYGDALSDDISAEAKVPTREAQQSLASPKVFIIHGRDKVNLSKLEKLLREHWHLRPVVMGSEPGKGRTLIERFDEEADRADFAIALVAPEDVFGIQIGGYGGGVPHVLFEIGCFYGRLGKDRVCILFRSGTRIHSDLDGIPRIQFENSIDEKVSEIERELEHAGILSK
jgi:predicted nucleotide-binding protein